MCTCGKAQNSRRACTLQPGRRKPVPLPGADLVGRKRRQLVKTRRSPTLGSSSRVEAKVRMWFPTLWRPQKICILASCRLRDKCWHGTEGSGVPSTCPHCSPLPRLMPEVPLPYAPCSCPALPLTHILLLPQPGWSPCPGQALWLCLFHDHGQGPFRSPSYLGHICSLWIEKSHSVRAEVLEGCVPRVLTCPPVPSPAPSPAPACLPLFL